MQSRVSWLNDAKIRSAVHWILDCLQHTRTGVRLLLAISSMMNLMNFRGNSKPRSPSSISPPPRLIAALSLPWNMTFLSTAHWILSQHFLSFVENNWCGERKRWEVSGLLWSWEILGSVLPGRWAGGISNDCRVWFLHLPSSYWARHLSVGQSRYLFYKQIVQRSVMKPRRLPW